MKPMSLQELKNKTKAQIEFYRHNNKIIFKSGLVVGYVEDDAVMQLIEAHLFNFVEVARNEPGELNYVIRMKTKFFEI